MPGELRIDVVLRHERPTHGHSKDHRSQADGFHGMEKPFKLLLEAWDLHKSLARPNFSARRLLYSPEFM
jgi:hypothetical protein